MHASLGALTALTALQIALCAPAFAQGTIQDTADRTKGSTPYKARVDAFLDGTLPKIVNGEPAVAGQLPWQVSLGVSWIASPAQGHFCGGSIYNEKWIVTAAHCVDGNSPDSVVVTAATIDLTQSGQRRNVSRVLVKSGYIDASQGSDIALLELMTPLTFGGPDLAAIPLLAEADEAATMPEGATLTTSGFGYTEQGGTVSSTLNFVDIPLVSSSICNAPQSYNGQITDDMICAGNTEGGEDSCQGDSGGPLVSSSVTTPKLAGIVSWGEGCAQPLKFGVYSLVSKFVNWVEACIAGGPECTTK